MPEICSNIEIISTTQTRFSEQQQNIIEYVLKKYRYKEIAQALKISASAVGTQVQRIKEKISDMPPGNEKLMLERIICRKHTISNPSAIFDADKVNYQARSHFRRHQNKAKQTKDLIARAGGRLYCIDREKLKNGISKIIQRELRQIGYTKYDENEDRITYKLSIKCNLKPHEVLARHKFAAATVDATIKAVSDCIASIYPNVSDEVYELQLKKLRQIYLSAERRILTDDEKDVILDEPEWKSMENWAKKQRKPPKK